MARGHLTCGGPSGYLARVLAMIAQGVADHQPCRVAPGEGGFLVLHDEDRAGVDLEPATVQPATSSAHGA